MITDLLPKSLITKKSDNKTTNKRINEHFNKKINKSELKTILSLKKFLMKQ